MDVWNFVHAEEHGIVGTPLPIRFTACEARIRNSIRPEVAAQQACGSAHRGRQRAHFFISHLLFLESLRRLTWWSVIRLLMTTNRTICPAFFLISLTQTHTNWLAWDKAKDRWYVGNPLSLKTSPDMFDGTFVLDSRGAHGAWISS